ncbi:MAG: TIM barrel protein [Acidobacteriota bacterium]|nr:TIM barrel protein [Acidobacteriota bacterium]
MNSGEISRRAFTGILGLGAFAQCAPAGSSPRTIPVGHTGITWGNNSAQAIHDVSALGYYGFETFGDVLERWAGDPALDGLLAEAKLPLISGYCSFNLTDSTKRAGELAKMKKWGGLIRKYGGSVSVLGPNGVDRANYNFEASRTNIIETLNECGKMLTDEGLTPVLHQHTGTCIETRDEVYTVLDAADPRYVKFGPDIGQLQKGGSDPVRVVKDYLPLVHHMHLKDYDGGPAYQGYCPLGRGKVNIPAILDMVEKGQMRGRSMVELDPSRGMPVPAGETAAIAKSYLEKLGYQFRS